MVLAAIGLAGCTSYDRSAPSTNASSPSSAPDPTLAPSSEKASSEGRTVVHTGTYEGSQSSWRLHAELPSSGGLCLHGPHVGACGLPTRGEGGEIVALASGSGTTPTGEEGCLFGAVDPEAVSVQVAFAEGGRRELGIEGSELSEELAFFGTCWESSDDVELIETLDASGGRLDARELDTAASVAPSQLSGR